MYTVKGQSRSDSLLLSPYHWAKLFRGVVAIVAVPMRFAVIISRLTPGCESRGGCILFLSFLGFSLAEQF